MNPLLQKKALDALLEGIGDPDYATHQHHSDPDFTTQNGKDYAGRNTTESEAGALKDGIPANLLSVELGKSADVDNPHVTTIPSAPAAVDPNDATFFKESDKMSPAEEKIMSIIAPQGFSYGAHVTDGTTLFFRGSNERLSFDPKTGLVTFLRGGKVALECPINQLKESVSMLKSSAQIFHETLKRELGQDKEAAIRPSPHQVFEDKVDHSTGQNPPAPKNPSDTDVEQAKETLQNAGQPVGDQIGKNASKWGEKIKKLEARHGEPIDKILAGEEEHGNAPDTGEYDEEHEAHVREEAKGWAQYAEEADNTDEIKPYDPSGDYLCGTCDMRRGANECARVDGEIGFTTGSCRLFHLGDPETDPPMKEKFSKEDAKYAERPNEKGFGCKRCEYGSEAKKADSEGRQSWCSFWGMHVVPTACCAENEGEDDKTFVKASSIKAADDHHHERTECRKCGNVQTCRCSAKKTTSYVDSCSNCDGKTAANPNQTVKNFRRKNPFPPIPESEKRPIDPFIEWFVQEVQAGRTYNNNLDEARAEYDKTKTSAVTKSYGTGTPSGGTPNDPTEDVQDEEDTKTGSAKTAEVGIHETPTMLPPRDDLRRHLDEDVKDEVMEGVMDGVKDTKVADYELDRDEEAAQYLDTIGDMKNEAKAAFMEDPSMQQYAVDVEMPLEELWKEMGEEFTENYFASSYAKQGSIETEEGLVCPNCKSPKGKAVKDDEADGPSLQECLNCGSFYQLQHS